MHTSSSVVLFLDLFRVALHDSQFRMQLTDLYTSVKVCPTTWQLS